LRLSPSRSPRPGRGRGAQRTGGAPTGLGFSVLRLTATLCADRTDELAIAVTARVAACADGASTVILTLESDPPPDRTMREALYALQDRLCASGIRLRLVVGASKVRRYLEQAEPDSAAGRLAVHPTTRTAVLASYAELSGPGLVTGSVRAALVAPSERLVLPDLHPPRVSTPDLLVPTVCRRSRLLRGGVRWPSRSAV
jgi:hypothetical protein